MFKESVIRQAASSLDIPMIGFTTPEPYHDWLSVLKTRREKGQITAFERTKPEKRITYDNCLDGLKTIIVIGMPYPSSAPVPDDVKERARVASVAWGKDYHQLLTEKMTQLSEILKQDCPDLKARCYVDNSRLLDRLAAYRAGLGFFGKNNTLIHREYGSHFFIGQLLINQDVDYEKVLPLESQCGTCRRCLDACPNKALEDGFTLEPNRCIAYLTQKKSLTDEEKEQFGNYIYGCDICQAVCPYNMGKELLYQGDTEWLFPKLDDLIHMDEATFKKEFLNTAAGWRGQQILIRNAEIIKEKRKKLCKEKNKCYNE